MKTIKFTVACHKEISDKIEIDYFLDNVTCIDITKYTKTIEHILIIFQGINPQSPRKVETFKKMRRKTKTLELYLVLDYDRIMQGSDEENLQHIKEVFRQGCQTFLKDMKGFDWEAFSLVIND